MNTICPVCGEEGKAAFREVRDARYAIAGEWTYLRCETCGLLWIDPMPQPEEVPLLYPDDYETHSAVRVHGQQERSPRGAVVRALQRACGYNRDAGPALLGRLLLALPPLQTWFPASLMWLPGEKPGRLLDVGCGTGWFPGKMRSLGWDAIGLEPDGAALRAARPSEACLVQGDLLALPSDIGTFDAITLHHVIEHLPSPLEQLKAIRRLLRPGGRVVLVTPNAQSWGFQLFGRHCWHLEPPRHLYLYTARALATLASRAGLVPVQTLTISRSADQVFLKSRQIGEAGGEFHADHVHGLGRRMAGQVFRAAEELCRLLAGSSGEELAMVFQTPPCPE